MTVFRFFLLFSDSLFRGDDNSSGHSFQGLLPKEILGLPGFSTQ